MGTTDGSGRSKARALRRAMKPFLHIRPWNRARGAFAQFRIRSGRAPQRSVCLQIRVPTFFLSISHIYTLQVQFQICLPSGAVAAWRPGGHSPLGPGYTRDEPLGPRTIRPLDRGQRHPFVPFKSKLGVYFIFFFRLLLTFRLAGFPSRARRRTCDVRVLLCFVLNWLALVIDRLM